MGACGTAPGSGAGGRAARVQSAPRVQSDRDRSFGFALSEQASGRRATAPAAAGVGAATPPLRLSQVGLAIGSRGARDESQKTVPALPRGAADGAWAPGS